MNPSPDPHIAVVIPCFRVAAHVVDVIKRIGPEVGWIFAVDDACPDHSGDVIEQQCYDQRIQVLRHETNLGVGGAMMTGYKAALAVPALAIVKLDGDGQMDPAMIQRLCEPLLKGRADYAKDRKSVV